MNSGKTDGRSTGRGRFGGLVFSVLRVAVILGIPGWAYADRTFRCGASLIEIGDDKETVLFKCGEPNGLRRWEEDPNSYISQVYDYELERYRLPRLIKGPILVECWTYDLGANCFIRRLYFQNGKV